MAPFLLSLLIIPLTFLLTKSVDVAQMHRIPEPSGHISPIIYLLTQVRVIATYLRLLLSPINQNVDYDYPIAKSLFQLPVLASGLLLLLLISAAVRLARDYRITSFSILWFFLTLLPESSIIPIRDVIFEHRLYLPMAGYSIFLASAIYYCVGKKAVIRMTLILIMIVSWYALLAYARNLVWTNDLTLWEDTARKSPDKARPYFNRGIAYVNEKAYKNAFADFDKSLMLNYKQIGEVQDYAGIYKKLIMSKHGYAELANFMGAKYAEISLFEQAIRLFKIAIGIYPSKAEYLTNLCAAYGDLKRFKEAVKAGEAAVGLDQNSAGAHYNLAVAYYFDNQRPLALNHLGTATKLGFTPDPVFIAKLNKTQ